MGVSLTPVGPGVPPNLAGILKSHEDAIRALQQPGAPVVLPHVALKTDLPPADSYRECAAICDEIHSVVVSTPTAGVYAWTRADGTAL